MNTKYTPHNQMTGFRMVGGVSVDESTLDDDAVYWRMGAKGAYLAAQKLMTKKQQIWFDEIRGKYWNEDLSWKQICLNMERFRDHFKALCNA